MKVYRSFVLIFFVYNVQAFRPKLFKKWLDEPGVPKSTRSTPQNWKTYLKDLKQKQKANSDSSWRDTGRLYRVWTCVNNCNVAATMKFWRSDESDKCLQNLDCCKTVSDKFEKPDFCQENETRGGDDDSSVPEHVPSIQCDCENGVGDIKEGKMGKRLRCKTHPCKSCDAGYHLGLSYRCSVNKCKCKKGTGTKMNACPIDGEHVCSSCRKGYTLKNKKCVKKPDDELSSTRTLDDCPEKLNKDPYLSDFEDFSARLSEHMFFNVSKNQNSLISPVSIQYALATLYVNYQGCDPLGIDWMELLTLNENTKKPTSSEFGVMNLIAHDKSIKLSEGAHSVLEPMIKKQKKNNFKKQTGVSMRVRNNDFDNAAKVRAGINKIVADATKNLIKEALPEDMEADIPTMKSIITNAVYFKGIWKEPFDKKNTKKYQWFSGRKMQKRPGKFIGMTQKSNSVAGIYKKELIFDSPIPETGDIEILKLPYQDEISLIVILSRNGNTELKPYLRDFRKYIKKDLMYFPGELDGTGVDIVLPKFKMEFSTELKNMFSGLGAKVPLETSGLFDEVVSFDDGKHTAVIDVNEKGTEGAAATVLISRSMNEEFIADREFLYMIYNQKSDRVLFSGHFVEPEFV